MSVYAAIKNAVEVPPVTVWHKGDSPVTVRHWDTATRQGSTFTFNLTDGTSIDVTLSVADTTAVISGAPVLVDIGANVWMEGIVVSDGATFTSGGVTFTTATRAATLADPSLQGAPTTGAAFTLKGTASDGTVWFANSEGEPALRTLALSTVGTLATGAMLVETDTAAGSWTWVNV